MFLLANSQRNSPHELNVHRASFTSSDYCSRVMRTLSRKHADQLAMSDEAIAIKASHMTQLRCRIGDILQVIAHGSFEKWLRGDVRPCARQLLCSSASADCFKDHLGPGGHLRTFRGVAGCEATFDYGGTDAVDQTVRHGQCEVVRREGRPRDLKRNSCELELAVFSWCYNWRAMAKCR